MTVVINIAGNSAAEALQELHALAAGASGKQIPSGGDEGSGAAGGASPSPAASSEPSLVPAAVAELVEPAKKTRGKKAPAADAVIEPANDSEPAGLTIEQVRERTRKFASDGFMDEVAAEMEARGIKKMSQVDPDAAATNAPSPKFAEYVAAIEKRVAAKTPATGE